MPLARRPVGMVREGLRLGVVEAIVVGAMFAASEAWLVPLLVHRLGAAASIVGLLAIVPQLSGIGIGQLSRQLIALLGGNKRTAILVAAIQAGCMAALSIPLQCSSAPWSVPLATGLILTFGVVGTLGGPAWISWMGGLIPRSLQGRYSSRRTRMFHASRLACAAIFAGIIHLLPLAESPWGMQLILIAATISRIVSVLVQRRQAEPVPRPAADHGNPSGEPIPANFRVFLVNLPWTPIGRWTLVWGLLHFGVMIAGPFFSPYMLAATGRGGLGLGDSPYLYTLLIYTSTVVRLITYPIAGRLVDLHSAPAVLRLAVIIITIIPLGWLAGMNLWLIVAFEILSGIGWSLAEVSIGPLLFSCHRDPAMRARLVGWHQSVVMTGIVLGSGLGTLLVDAPWLPALTGSTFHTLFLLSMLLRLPAVIAAVRLLPRLKEIPHGTHNEGELWRLIPGAGMTVTVGRGLGGFFRRTEGE